MVSETILKEAVTRECYTLTLQSGFVREDRSQGDDQKAPRHHHEKAPRHAARRHATTNSALHEYGLLVKRGNDKIPTVNILNYLNVMWTR